MPAHEGKQFLAQNLSHYWANLLSLDEGGKRTYVAEWILCLLAETRAVPVQTYVSVGVWSKLPKSLVLTISTPIALWLGQLPHPSCAAHCTSTVYTLFRDQRFLM